MSIKLDTRGRRFRCLNPNCLRRAFAEPLPESIGSSHARRSMQLAGEQRYGGFALGGESDSLLANDAVAIGFVPWDLRATICPGKFDCPSLAAIFGRDISCDGSAGVSRGATATAVGGGSAPACAEIVRTGDLDCTQSITLPLTTGHLWHILENI